jgi:hypothetical protein
MRNADMFLQEHLPKFLGQGFGSPRLVLTTIRVKDKKCSCRNTVENYVILSTTPAGLPLMVSKSLSGWCYRPESTAYM